MRNRMNNKSLEVLVPFKDDDRESYVKIKLMYWDICSTTSASINGPTFREYTITGKEYIEEEPISEALKVELTWGGVMKKFKEQYPNIEIDDYRPYDHPYEIWASLKGGNALVLQYIPDTNKFDIRSPRKGERWGDC